jgi:multidrug resistance efflux pump
MNELDKILDELTKLEEQPTEGHLERFNSKLRKQHNKLVFYRWLKIAAAFVLVYLSADLYVRVISPSTPGAQISANEQEIKNAGSYYNFQIESEMEQVENLIKEGAGSEKDLQEVKNEFSKMDQQYQDLRRDYLANPNDERVQSALIQYYQSKLEIVTIVKGDLEIVKQQKLKYDENIKI